MSGLDEERGSVGIGGLGSAQKRGTQPEPGMLALSHMDLVGRIARQVHGRVSSMIEIEDLTQIGMVALVDAANAYRDRGHAFATYATVRIRGEMIDHLRRHAPISRSAMRRRQAIGRTAARLEREQRRTPTEAELAVAMGMAPAAFRKMVDCSMPALHEPLDQIYSDRSMDFAEERESADAAIERAQSSDALASQVARLTQVQQMVIQLYFVDELNLVEIGLALDLTASRVCQIKSAALRRLRELLDETR